MKLTVGSLPSAVYWRRRVAVLAGIVIAILLLYAACSGADGSGKKQKTAATGRSGTSGSSSSLLTPTTEAPPSSASATPQTQSSSTPAPSAQSATCTDDEISVTPAPASATVTRGQEVVMYLKVKNISGRACSRDLGADAQELYLLDASGAAKMWSSDACGAVHTTSVRTLAPGAEQVFNALWNGRTTSGGCGAQELPAAGQYQLVARLGEKTSAPVAVTVS